MYFCENVTLIVSYSSAKGVVQSSCFDMFRILQVGLLDNTTRAKQLIICSCEESHTTPWASGILPGVVIILDDFMI